MFPESFSTTRLTLRPVQIDDAQAIFDRYAQDPEVTRFLTWRPHESLEDSRAYVEMCLKAESSRVYMMILQSSGQAIGALDLRKSGNSKLEYGCVLARSFWGQGLMTEALVEVVDWALRQSSIWRIGAVADVENVGSIRVMQKAGLQQEGVLRRWLTHPNISDVPRDCLSFARTR